MRKTKIICTIGPRTAAFESLKKLADHGMNVARLNMSHSTQQWHGEVIRNIKRINKKFGHSIAIMLDTKGAEVRSGDVKQDLALKTGDILTLTTRRQAELEPYCVEVSYDGFINEVELGDIILVDGGMIRLLVKEITRTDVRCECLDDGLLTSRRHLNIRGKSADLPAITEQDWRDIDFGIEQRIDFIALSFVRSAAPILELKQYLRERQAPIELLAKIESAASIPRLGEIIAAGDGIMIARGDLGSEMPYEEVPLLQDEIIRQCRAAGKPVIVATHMLESMIVNPTPTRAEVTDITHAIQQGTDAIMLSGETATGRHPFKALEVMDTVAKRIEKHLALDPMIRIISDHVMARLLPPAESSVGAVGDAACPAGRLSSKEEISRSAAILGNNLEATGTLVITRRGLMAALLSHCRPAPPIFAFTNTTHVRRRLGIYWGVHALLVKLSSDPEVSIQRAIEQLLKKALVKPGDRIIVLSDILAGGKFVETVQVRII